MNRIAAKVAQKVAMFLEHRHVDPVAREKIAKHHAGGAAADHTASRANDGGVARRTLVAGSFLAHCSAPIFYHQGASPFSRHARLRRSKAEQTQRCDSSDVYVKSHKLAATKHS